MTMLADAVAEADISHVMLMSPSPLVSLSLLIHGAFLCVPSLTSFAQGRSLLEPRIEKRMTACSHTPYSYYAHTHSKMGRHLCTSQDGWDSDTLHRDTQTAQVYSSSCCLFFGHMVSLFRPSHSLGHLFCNLHSPSQRPDFLLLAPIWGFLLEWVQYTDNFPSGYNLYLHEAQCVRVAAR